METNSKQAWVLLYTSTTCACNTLYLNQIITLVVIVFYI